MIANSMAYSYLTVTYPIWCGFCCHFVNIFSCSSPAFSCFMAQNCRYLWRLSLSPSTSVCMCVLLLHMSFRLPSMIDHLFALSLSLCGCDTNWSRELRLWSDATFFVWILLKFYSKWVYREYELERRMRTIVATHHSSCENDFVSKTLIPNAHQTFPTDLGLTWH